MAEPNFEAPPLLVRSLSYKCWVKEIERWQNQTLLEPKKRGLTIFLTLDNNIRKLIKTENLTSVNGVQHLIKQLDKIFLAKDQEMEMLEKFNAIEKFENFKRSPDMSLLDYMGIFQYLWKNIQKHGSYLSSDILAYKLLKSACLTTTQEDQIKSSIHEITYENMRKELQHLD